MSGSYQCLTGQFRFQMKEIQNSSFKDDVIYNTVLNWGAEVSEKYEIEIWPLPCYCSIVLGWKNPDVPTRGSVRQQFLMNAHWKTLVSIELRIYRSRVPYPNQIVLKQLLKIHTYDSLALRAFSTSWVITSAVAVRQTGYLLGKFLVWVFQIWREPLPGPGPFCAYKLCQLSCCLLELQRTNVNCSNGPVENILPRHLDNCILSPQICWGKICGNLSR